MADNTDLLKQIRQVVLEVVKPIEDTQQKQGETLTRQTNIMSGIGSSVATLLEDHSAQRTDIRTLHTEVHATKTELQEEVRTSREETREEIRTAREEAKRDTMDLKATVIKQVKDHEKRIETVENAAGIPNPNKH